MVEKIREHVNKFIFDRNVVNFLLIYVCVIIVSCAGVIIHDSFSPYSIIKFDDFIFIIGYVLSIFIALPFSYLMLKIVKVRILPSIIISLVWGVVLYFLVESFSMRISLGNQDEFYFLYEWKLDQIFFSFLSGIILNFIIFAVLVYTKASSAIYLGIILIFSGIINSLKLNAGYLAIVLLVFSFVLGLALPSYIKGYKIKFRELFKPGKISGCLSVVMILGSVFVFAAYLEKYYYEWKEEIYEIRSIQYDHSFNLDGKKSSVYDKHFADKTVTPEPYIVGYYKASHPMYLKTNVYTVDLNSFQLTIQEAEMDDMFSYLYEYKDYCLEKYDAERVQLIYRYADYEAIPTAERIVSFDQTLYYSYSYNLLREAKYSSEKISFSDYGYAEYDPSVDWNHFAPEYMQSGCYGYYYDDEINYISEYSDRYEEIQGLAEDITSDAKSTYDKAKAIENYFRSNYYYTTKPGIEDKENPIDDFIFDKKKGYCSYFATSMVIMLESLDIDSRLVGGFYSDYFSSDLEAYVMFTSDLHAWVEVFIDGYGWVFFDPTSGLCDPNDEKCNTDDEYRNFSELSKEQIGQSMEGVSPEIGFDDIFETEDTDDIGLIDDGKSDDEIQEDWVDENKVDEEEQKKREIEERREKRKQDIKNTLRFSATCLIVIFILLVFILVAYKIYDRIMHWKYYIELANKKKVRKLRRKLLGKISDKLENPGITEMSNVNVLRKLEALNIDLQAFKEFFKLSDRILYSKRYSNEDMINITNLDNIARDEIKKLLK
ncbi:MAG: transglutaminase domain-containing protein [Candidatus Dojkabacteria bacterium]|nr:transglutaminase domain-containing protein [Candidatus Dojkabacteria bacterium]